MPKSNDGTVIRWTAEEKRKAQGLICQHCGKTFDASVTSRKLLDRDPVQKYCSQTCTCHAVNGRGSKMPCKHCGFGHDKNHTPKACIQAELAQLTQECDAVKAERDELKLMAASNQHDALTQRGRAIEWTLNYENMEKERDRLQAQLATAKQALEQVLIKVDWNSDEFHNLKQYNETRQIILKALADIQAQDFKQPQGKEKEDDKSS